MEHISHLILENTPKRIHMLIGLKACDRNTKLARAVDVMMPWAKRIYILMIKVNKVHIPERSESSSLINIIYIVCLRVTLYTCIYVYVQVLTSK